ncbi:MAG: extracellular solute-binding protein [Eubacteriales bacterium]|nr:extracellular solute-binding protein [Eubacteriales bacterium]
MNRSKGIRLIAAAACALLLCSCTAKNTQEEAPKAQPTEISVAFWNVADEWISDPLQQYVEEKFNIRLVPINVSYDNYSQWLQQMAATNELPDIIAHDIMGTSAYESWITQQKIRALPKDLTDYPNLEAYLEQPYNERFKRGNGAFYAIPRLTYSTESLWALDRCIMVRKDWREALGLSVPQSWDEFAALLFAFVNGDPDGNGMSDTKGLTATHLNTLEAVYLSLFPELSNTERGWLYEDGKWMPVYCSQKTAPALEKMRQLYRRGLMDTEFAFVSTKEAAESFVRGEFGAICGQYYLVLNTLAEQGMLDQASDMVEILPPWPCEDGSRYRFTTSLHWSESYFGANVDDEKMKIILSLYDWLLSDDFRYIYQHGLEGVDWEWENGSRFELRHVSPVREYSSLAILSHLVEWNQDDQYVLSESNALTYGEANLNYAREQLTWFARNTKRVNYNFDVVFMSTPAKNSLVYNSVVQQEMAKIIMGTESALTAWPKTMRQLEETTTLSAAIDEVTREANRLGIQP